MKQTIALILALILCISCAICISADTAVDMDSAAAENELAVMQTLADAHLSQIRTSSDATLSAMGLSRQSVSNGYFGTPFQVQTVTLTGEMPESNIYSCPLIYRGQIVAVLRITNDCDENEYFYTFGKGLADALNTLATSNELNAENGLAIGVMENITFATDGTDFEIIHELPAYGFDAVSSTDIQDVCSSVYASAEYKFFLQ